MIAMVLSDGDRLNSLRRATFASDEDEYLKGIMAKTDTLTLYDPMHQLGQINPVPQVRYLHAP